MVYFYNLFSFFFSFFTIFRTLWVIQLVNILSTLSAPTIKFFSKGCYWLFFCFFQTILLLLFSSWRFNFLWITSMTTQHEMILQIIQNYIIFFNQIIHYMDHKILSLILPLTPNLLIQIWSSSKFKTRSSVSFSTESNLFLLNSCINFKRDEAVCRA